MKTGDFIVFKGGHGDLYICSNVDLQNGLIYLNQVVNMNNDLIDPEQKPWPVNINHKGMFIPTQTDIDAIMNGRAFPQWVKSISSIVNSQFISPSLNTNVSYKIGSMLLGTGKSGNIWIVNKDNSNDISLLFNGRARKWCQSSMDKNDKANPVRRLQIVDEAEVYDFINKHHGMRGFSLPQWALNLRSWGGVASSIAQTSTSVKPEALKSIQGTLNLKPKEPMKIKVENFRDKCNHEFNTYMGFTDIYDYCIKCDVKRATKQ